MTVDAIMGRLEALEARVAALEGKNRRPEPGSQVSIAPPIPTDLASQRTELAELEREQAQIRHRLRSLVGRGDPHDERRVSFVESRMGLLRSHIKVAELGLGIRT